MKYAFMKQWREIFSIGAMSRVLEVSRSGYYDWLTRGPSNRSREDERLKIEIRTAHERSRETYGPRRLQPELAASGTRVGRDRIIRLRRDLICRARLDPQHLSRRWWNKRRRRCVRVVAVAGTGYRHERHQCDKQKPVHRFADCL